MKWIIPASLLALSVLSLQQCSNADETSHKLAEGEAVISRQDAIQKFRMGAYLNADSCPSNYYPALYAVESAFPSEVNSPYYTAASVESCFLLLLATPCAPNPDTKLVLMNLYRSVIRYCGLKEAAL
jgi:hypothetical protein